MKKKMTKILTLGFVMATLSSMSAFAAGWGKLGSDWFYYQEDGMVAKNTWVNTLTSVVEGGELSHTVGSKDLPVAEGMVVTASYWVKNDGKMAVSDWVCDGGAWYRVDEKGNIMKNQLYTENKDMYCLGEDGRMLVNDWHLDEDGRWYYFKEDGRTVKHAWRMIDGSEYYFLRSGAMATSVAIPGGGHVGADGKRDS